MKRFGRDTLSFSTASSPCIVAGTMSLSAAVMRTTNGSHAFGALAWDSVHAPDLPHVTFKLPPRLQTHALPLTCSLLPPDS
jgi:hypothetical protein